MRLTPLTIELPTGRIVSIATAFDPLRPWELRQISANTCTIVRRKQGLIGGQERLKEAGQRVGGLVLTPEDADALMAVLSSRIEGPVPSAVRA